MNKRMLRTSVVVAGLAVGSTTASFAGFVGQVINFDFNEPRGGRANISGFAGDNAVLSSPGGTTWNDVVSFSGSLVTSALDQFGAGTPVDLQVIQTSQFSGLTAANELQDSGLASPEGVLLPQANGEAEGGGGPIVVGPNELAFVVSGLLQSEFYALAVYISEQPKVSSTDVFVHHAGGTSFLPQSNSPTYALPGQSGGDYHLFGGLAPMELSPGLYGFLVTAGGGADVSFIGNQAYIGGFQLQGVVPEPATLCLVLVGVASLWRFRRRSA